jgi:hypothetical protein
MSYYKIAIATGLSHSQALLFESAMLHKNKPDINHLTIK